MWIAQYCTDLLVLWDDVILYSLNFLREKIFADFTDFCQTTKILTLKFLSSNAIQYNISVIHEIFIQKIPKFINPRKYSPLKNFRLYRTNGVA